MLRISYHEAGPGIELKLEGRIAGPWSEELARFWEQTGSRLASGRLSIDLREVTYADSRGIDILRVIYAQTQAELVAHTAWTRHLAEEIQTARRRPGEGELSDYRGMFRSLRSAPGRFFNQLSPETFDALARIAGPLRCAPGEVLFEEGDYQMGSVYLVLDGNVKLTIARPCGRTETYAVARKGDMLGMASALSGAPPEMSAEAMDQVQMARIWREDLLQFLLDHPDAYDALIEEVRDDILSAVEFRRTMTSAEVGKFENPCRPH